MPTRAEADAIRQLMRDAAASGTPLSFHDAQRQVANPAKDLVTENVAKLFALVAALQKELAETKAMLNSVRVVGEGHSGTGPHGMMFNPAAVADEPTFMLAVFDEGAPILSDVREIDFIGQYITATNPAGTGGNRIEVRTDQPDPMAVLNEGDVISLSPPTMDFVGTGVDAAADMTGAVTVTIPGTAVLDEDVSLTTNALSLNFTGTGVSASDAGGDVTIAISGLEVLDEGGSLTSNAISLNFVGWLIDGTSSGDDVTITINFPEPPSSGQYLLRSIDGVIDWFEAPTGDNVLTSEEGVLTWETVEPCE